MSVENETRSYLCCDGAVGARVCPNRFDLGKVTKGGNGYKQGVKLDEAEDKGWLNPFNKFRGTRCPKCAALDAEQEGERHG